MPDADPTADVAALTVQLLSAYLANNTVPSDELAGLIRSTRDALTQEVDTLGKEEPETFTPAVSMRKSLASPAHIISLIDGKQYKTLKRHLMAHGLTPEAYRSRYNLPANYPMVAPAYGEHRRNIARQSGLGNRRPAVEDAATSQVEEPLAPSFDDAAATKPPSAHEDIAQTRGSVVTKKRRASAKSKATTSDKAAPVQVAPTADAAQAPVTGQDTSSSAPGEQSLPDNPTPEASTGKATSSAKEQGVNVSSAKPSKGRTGKPKHDAMNEPAPSQTESEGAGVPSEEQNARTTAPKPKRRAKLGLFSGTGSKPGNAFEGAAAQSAETPSSPQEPEGGDLSGNAKAPAKRKSFKRMARTPEAASDAPRNGSGS